MAHHTTVAIVIATTGRRHLLTEMVRDLTKQTRHPDVVAICPADDADIDDKAISELDLPILVRRGARGACTQRNTLLSAVTDVDLVVFFDDDFFPCPTYLAEAVDLFERHRDIVLATGDLIANGANGAGLDVSAARDLLNGATPAPRAKTEDVFSGYGCNMVVRASVLTNHAIRFDENLPLYSWAEDLEFSRQLARHGRLVKCNRLSGVHLGTRIGRTSELRLGYSQVANQIYLTRKGAIPLRRAIVSAGRNILANLGGLARPERHIDRQKRLLGNIYGVVDLVRGRSSPDRILDL